MRPKSNNCKIVTIAQLFIFMWRFIYRSRRGCLNSLNVLTDELMRILFRKTGPKGSAKPPFGCQRLAELQHSNSHFLSYYSTDSLRFSVVSSIRQSINSECKTREKLTHFFHMPSDQLIFITDCYVLIRFHSVCAVI